MTKLTTKQVNQLRYELKRRVLSCIDYAADQAIEEVINSGVEFGNTVTLEFALKQKISDKVVEGRIQLEAISHE